MKFEWDQAKAAANLKKHDVSFEEARRIRIISARLAKRQEREDYEQNGL
ncbi:MAG: hypothetical protein ACTS2F_02170 [Thainema sp.]